MTLKIITDPATGKQFARDDSVPGSQFAPYTAALPSLSGTQPNTPNPNAQPSLPGQTTQASAPTLPSGGNTSPILAFADSLNQAVNLAKQHRNASSLSLMQPLQGTVAASDFNSILGNLNQASDTTTQDLIKQTTDIQTPDIVTTTNDNGDVSGIDKTTGKVLWTAPGVGNKQTGKAASTKDNKENDIATAIVDFQTQMQKRGWAGANPDAYNHYRSELTKLYGASAALELDKQMADLGITVDNTNL